MQQPHKFDGNTRGLCKTTLPNGGVYYEPTRHSKHWIRGRDVVLVIQAQQDRTAYQSITILGQPIPWGWWLLEAENHLPGLGTLLWLAIAGLALMALSAAQWR